MRQLVNRSVALRGLRAIVAVMLVSTAAAAMAVCQPPDSSIDWRFVGEITQNVRTTRLAYYDRSGWSTVASVVNHTSSDRRETLSASRSENQLVSYAIERWGLGTSSSSTWTHRVDVTVRPGQRVRLLRKRREEIRDITWDVVCAWQHRVTGDAAITWYGRYSGTFWRLFDAFEVRSEPA
jgi:hypothetical protein